MIAWHYKALATLLLAFALFGGGWYAGHHGATLKANATIAQIRADDAQALARAQEVARAKEQASAAKLAAISNTYEQEKADAQAKSYRVIADLRAGNLRLRQEWQCPSGGGMSATAGTSGQPDAAAELRNEGAANLVRLAAEADAQIRGLQEVIRADRNRKLRND